MLVPGHGCYTNNGENVCVQGKGIRFGYVLYLEYIFKNNLQEAKAWVPLKKLTRIKISEQNSTRVGLKMNGCILLAS